MVAALGCCCVHFPLGAMGLVLWRTLTVWSAARSLYMVSPPQGYLGGSNLKRICQALCDPRRHMPLYSSYTF
ncbi:unnamed protein product [Coregonus sp. 'balchen']|nr:unnamed protein product [Coregonus sp. 'balchen']